MSFSVKRICVFGASSKNAPDVYRRAAYDMGRLIAEHGLGMVFGAGKAGLMGEAARGASSVGGEIIGVIPRKLNIEGIYFEGCTERIQTETMHERKATMERLSDAYIALAGGFGTIEELMEVLTLKQLGYFDCPIVLLNTCGYYNDLIAQLRTCVERGFTNVEYLKLYHIASDPGDAMGYILSYSGMAVRDKLADATVK